MAMAVTLTATLTQEELVQELEGKLHSMNDKASMNDKLSS